MIYAEDYAQARALRENYRQCGVYFRNGRPFAWQFAIPQSKINFILKRFFGSAKPESETITNQQLTGHPPYKSERSRTNELSW